MIINFSPSNIPFCVRKRNVSMRRFFYAPKNVCFIDSYSNGSKIGPLVSQIFFEKVSISKIGVQIFEFLLYFEKLMRFGYNRKGVLHS